MVRATTSLFLASIATTILSLTSKSAAGRMLLSVNVDADVFIVVVRFRVVPICV
jgi:hypothetical protein